MNSAAVTTDVAVHNDFDGERSWFHLHVPAQEMSNYVLDKICQRGRLLVLWFIWLAKILLKHKHLDNEG